MTLGEILQRIRVELGEQSTFYPEPEIVESGVNPAQRLLCLAYPMLLQKRVVLSVAPEQIFTDLRQITPTIRRINRVVLGDVTANNAQLSATTGELKRLLPTHLHRLAGMNDWIAHRGKTKNYWLFGPFWFGLYRRPMDTLTLTLIYDAMPTKLVLEEEDALPDISSVYHPSLIDVAVGLLLQKEGAPETTRGMMRITETLKALQHDNLRRTA